MNKKLIEEEQRSNKRLQHCVQKISVAVEIVSPIRIRSGQVHLVVHFEAVAIVIAEECSFSVPSVFERWRLFFQDYSLRIKRDPSRS